MPKGPGSGILAIEQPWPSMMRTLRGDHDRFEKTYFSTFNGKYFTGDGARIDKDGYIWITGRVDVSCHQIHCLYPECLWTAASGLSSWFAWTAWHVRVYVNNTTVYPHTFICEPLQSVPHPANGGWGSMHDCAWFALTWSWCRRCEAYVSDEVYIFPHEDILYAQWPM